MGKNKATPTPSPFDRFNDNVLLQATPASVTSEDAAELPVVVEGPPVEQPPAVEDHSPPPLGAFNYSARALCSGEQVPQDFKADANPLLVKSLEILERIISGGLLSWSAYSAYNEIVDFIPQLREAVSCSPAPKT